MTKKEQGALRATPTGLVRQMALGLGSVAMAISLTFTLFGVSAQPLFGATCSPGQGGCGWGASDCVGSGLGGNQTCSCNYVWYQLNYKCQLNTL